MKALAFDLYGTLVDVGGLEEQASKVTKRPREFVTAWREKQLEYTLLIGQMGRYMPFFEVTSRALEAAAAKEGFGLKADARATLVRAWRELPAFRDAVPALGSLKGRIPMAVLTNAEVAMAADTLKHAGLDGFFGQVLSAEEVRTFKPNPRVYRLAAMRLHLEPKEIGLVSANPFDVIGAKAAGLHAIWVNRTKATFDRLDLMPDAEIENLSGLAAQL